MGGVPRVRFWISCITKLKVPGLLQRFIKPKTVFLWWRGGGVLPYIKLGLYHSGMCHCVGYDFYTFFLYFILSSTEIIKFTRKAKARGLNGLVSIIIIEDC